MPTARLDLVVVLALLAVVPPARALDCAKAQTADEKAICGDPQLKAQDAALSRIYFDTLRVLKGDRHALLIADQRRWLDEGRDSECEPADKMPSARVPCLSKGLAARQRAIAICFAGDKAGAATHADICPVFLRTKCPKVAANASAHLVDYPWLFDKLVHDAKEGIDGDDCGPEGGDATGTADQNAWSSTARIVTERPNFVSVRTEVDTMFRGAAHEEHEESLASYDTRSRAEIPVAAVLPSLKPGSPLLAAISKAANKVLDIPCCGDGDHTFQDIGLGTDQPMPNAWAVSAAGDLILGYDYNTMARGFIATAVIPRRLFIDAVDPKYAGLFVGDPTATSPLTPRLEATP